MPGATVADLVARMAEKTLQWEYQLAKAYMLSLPAVQRDALSEAYRGLPSLANDLRLYAQRILEGRTHLEIPPYRTLGLVTTRDIERIKELIGQDVTGWDYALDASTVGHIARGHGETEAEATRGQRAATAQDYARLPEILAAPDEVTDGGTSRVGRRVVRISRVIEGERHTAALELRGKRKTLALVSLWIRP